MQVKQIYDLVNGVTKEITGLENVLNEDLSNIVDVGKEIYDTSNIDNYVKALPDHIGKVIFVNRPYAGGAPSVLMDGWEYGSVVEKIMAEIPEATENETWELVDKQSYDPNVFYKPQVSAKFFNNKTTFEIPMSFTERQVKESFSSATQLNAFISMLYNSVEKSMTIKTDALIQRTINNMIAETFSNAGNNGSPRCINLLAEYNARTIGDQATVANCLNNPAFIRYAAYRMAITKDRMAKMSTLFNIGGKERFTTPDYLHLIMLSEFQKAAGVFMESDTYHDEYVKLPNAESVPFWQGSGKTYAFTDTSAIDVKLASDNTKTVQQSGILGVMFDRDALGVANLDRRVTTNYNPKAEFYSNWYKFDAGYYNDMNENFVVFYVA